MTIAMRPLALSLSLAASLACADSRADSPEARSAPPASPSVRPASTSAEAADVREMNAYRINMDDIRKWSAIMKKGEGKNLAKGETDGGEMTIDKFEASLDADPRARALIEAGGLDVHDFAVITMTMVQGALIDFAVAQGANGDSIARSAGLSLDNVRFIREHQKEITALQAK